MAPNVYSIRHLLIPCLQPLRWCHLAALRDLRGLHRVLLLAVRLLPLPRAEGAGHGEDHRGQENARRRGGAAHLRGGRGRQAVKGRMGYRGDLVLPEK